MNTITDMSFYEATTILVENYTSEEYGNTSVTAQNDFLLPPNYVALLLTPLILVVALGNIMVIVLVGADKRLRSPTNYFLSSLAVADMLVALTVMPPSLAMIVNNYIWPFSDSVCGLWTMLDVFFSTASILHLCMISFDRYMALGQPFSRKQSLTAPLGGVRNGSIPSVAASSGASKLSYVGRRIFLVWSVALGIALPVPIMGKVNRKNLFVGDMCAINMAKFQIFGSLAAFFLPLIIMFIMYTLTKRALNQQARLVSSIMVHNGRISPQISGHLSSNSRSSSVGKLRNLSSSERKTEQFEGNNRLDSESNDNDEQEPFLGCETCRKHETSKERSTHTWRKTLRPISKALRRVQRLLAIITCIDRKGNSTNTTSLTTTHNKNRCTCRSFDNGSNTNKNTEEFYNLQKLSRNCRATHGRVSSAFKNRAMVSISNEQRASKVLGLIFVLFCVFWCPFFITNVTSGLCTSCNQELLGNLLNWFVWVGYVSSGVNPCVYTMFSRRFRKTFFLLLRGKISEINRKSCRSQSLISNGSNGLGRNSRISSLIPTRISRYSLPFSNTTKQSSSSRLSEDFSMQSKLSTVDLKSQTDTVATVPQPTSTREWRWSEREQ